MASDEIRIKPEPPAQLFLSLSILWAAIATLVVLFMLFCTPFVTSIGFPLSIENSFMIFGVSATAFFIFIPPLFLTPEGDEDQTSVWVVLGMVLLLALITIPFLMIVRRVNYVDKLQLGAALSLLTVFGLSSSLFYILFPRLHFFFFSAISLGFPFFFVLVYELWGLKSYYIAGFSPFVTIYSISPEMALMKISLGWANTLLIFGLIALVCMAYLILWGRTKQFDT